MSKIGVMFNGPRRCDLSTVVVAAVDVRVACCRAARSHVFAAS